MFQVASHAFSMRGDLKRCETFANVWESQRPFRWSALSIRLQGGVETANGVFTQHSGIGSGIPKGVTMLMIMLLNISGRTNIADGYTIECTNVFCKVFSVAMEGWLWIFTAYATWLRYWMNVWFFSCLFPLAIKSWLWTFCSSTLIVFIYKHKF